MQKHRTTILMAVLLSLVGFYVFQSQQTLMPVSAGMERKEPLDGENEIRKLSIKPGRGGIGYAVEVDYRFRGVPGQGRLHVYTLENSNSSTPKKTRRPTVVAKQGVNKAEVNLRRDNNNNIAHSTRVVRVELFDYLAKRVVASKDIEHSIEWPRLAYAMTAERDKNKDMDTLYKEAVAEIDYGSKDSISNARVKLETILSKDTQFVAAYPEMARYHMKTNWGPEGLRQAEQALNSGLAIDPGHANSHVLIGYVYTHQGRYKEAEDAFTKASQIGTDNLWLWANWGELLLKQGQVAKSIAMYSKGIEGERPYNTYDRARKMAYMHLIDMYRLNNDIETVDELHLKRISEYGNEACFPYYYAEFRQRHFDDADITLKYARKALDASCRYETKARKVIGTAYYSKWIAAATPDEGKSYLTQARLFFPEGPELIYWLAQAEITTPVIKGLVNDGISIDVADNNGLTALAYAVKEDDFEALKRLIDMGGNPNATIGKEKLPLLAVAVLSQNKETVRYLVASGADVNAQVYGGASLLDLAEGMGFNDIAEVLKSAGGTRI